jgi:hypothetical protein
VSGRLFPGMSHTAVILEQEAEKHDQAFQDHQLTSG